MSVEHLPAPLSEHSATKKQKKQKPSAVCVLEKRGRLEKNLQALFIFQESRIVVKYCKYYSLPFLMASGFWASRKPMKLMEINSLPHKVETDVHPF